MNLSNFYPETVYFCDCLTLVIEKCKKGCSLQDLCNEINNNDIGDTIYCSKCGDGKQNVVFSCGNHLVMVSYATQNGNDRVVVITNDKHFCFSCIKSYLRRHYGKFLSKVNI